jgi:hypothetical protein
LGAGGRLRKMLFRVVCSDELRLAVVIEGSDITVSALKKKIVEEYLRFAKRCDLWKSFDEAQMEIVSVQDYYGYDLLDDTKCTILNTSDPNPGAPTIGVIFKRDFDKLRERFRDSQSLWRALKFCGKRKSFDFQAEPEFMHVDPKKSEYGEKPSILQPSSSNMNRGTGVAAKEQLLGKRSTAATKVVDVRIKKKPRDDSVVTPSILVFEAENLDGSAQPSSAKGLYAKTGDDCSGAEDYDQMASKVSRGLKRGMNAGRLPPSPSPYLSGSFPLQIFRRCPQ